MLRILFVRGLIGLHASIGRRGDAGNCRCCGIEVFRRLNSTAALLVNVFCRRSYYVGVDGRTWCLSAGRSLRSCITLWYSYRCGGVILYVGNKKYAHFVSSCPHVRKTSRQGKQVLLELPEGKTCRKKVTIACGIGLTKAARRPGKETCAECDGR